MRNDTISTLLNMSRAISAASVDGFLLNLVVLILSSGHVVFGFKI